MIDSGKKEKLMTVSLKKESNELPADFPYRILPDMQEI